jgi:uncharacterized membrane protein YdbT with pleckstrin-like domain
MQFEERKRLLFFGLPWTFTKYIVQEETITIRKGLLTLEEDDTYMYKVQDVKMIRSLMERIFGLSTLICYTGDVTHPELKLIHIKNGAEIKKFISEASENERRKKRTLHTMDIDSSAGEFDDAGE